MEARAVSVLEIFQKDMQIQVPLFQRRYVWNEQLQWAPLWEDIERKFREQINGRQNAPVHFLGAMVLAQKQSWTTDIERRQIIDGQQRLTTLQIFIAAFRDFCRENGVSDIADECNKYLKNNGILNNPSVDQFKILPTQLDRPQFSHVITALSPAAIDSLYPRTKKKYASKWEPRPAMVDAYAFFYRCFSDFFFPSLEDRLDDSNTPLRNRLLACFLALKNTLRVVTIDLQQDDDPQVIFETLNARGAPLLPADLLRNYIFLRAAQTEKAVEELYEQYWRKFDDSFWSTEERQGRYRRPRSDIFMQHFLASRRAEDVPVNHLFSEYKNWIEQAAPFESVTDELSTLARQRDAFARLLAPSADDDLYNLALFLRAFDNSTAYPLLLHLLDSGLSIVDWSRVSVVLESYLLRRAVCDLTAKNYNRFFLNIIRDLQANGTTADRLEAHLARQTSDTATWPDDKMFRDSWLTRHAYRTLSHPKLIHIFSKLNETYRTNKNEHVERTTLSVEHLMPQTWTEAWPLANGEKGLTREELWNVREPDERTLATQKRNEALQTIGNLTILTQSLNSAASNASWAEKKRQILESSLLPINQQLNSIKDWDEAAIQSRGSALFDRALTIWPRPS